MKLHFSSAELLELQIPLVKGELNAISEANIFFENPKEGFAYQALLTIYAELFGKGADIVLGDTICGGMMPHIQDDLCCEMGLTKGASECEQRLFDNIAKCQQVSSRGSHLKVVESDGSKSYWDHSKNSLVKSWNDFDDDKRYICLGYRRLNYLARIRRIFDLEPQVYAAALLDQKPSVDHGGDCNESDGKVVSLFPPPGDFS